MSFSTVRVIITDEMLQVATKVVPTVRVYRTRTSPHDTLIGILGEYVFAQWYLGDWRQNEVGENKGDSDFFGQVEIKTSAFPFSRNLNLIVREDYAAKRKPSFYVQVIIDIDLKRVSEIIQGTVAHIAGFATSEEIDAAPLKDFGSKSGGAAGYKCRHIKISNLSPMSEFHNAYQRK